MSNTHLISAADTILRGKARNAAYNKNGLPARGVELSHLLSYSYGAIAAADRDGLVASVNPADGATLTMDGALASGGVATFDVPRNVSIYATTDESAKTLTVTGTDVYGKALVETITGPAGNGATKIAYGNKAFKTVTSLVATGNFGTIEVGTGTKIGLPFRITSKNKALPMVNGRLVAPVTLTGTITAVGTSQTVAVASPLGGVVTEVVGVSAAANGTATSTVTVTNATLEVAVLAFTSAYSALTVLEDTSLLNTRIADNTAFSIATDGTGDGAGQATVTITVDPGVVTIADDTTATATTGDVRGTIDFGDAPNASKLFSVLMEIDASSDTNAFGIAQYSV